LFSFNKKRFYCFSRREPTESHDRVVFNELPTDEERAQSKSSTVTKVVEKPKEAILHTTVGDIAIKLFLDEAPRTVENFVVSLLFFFALPIFVFSNLCDCLLVDDMFEYCNE